MLVSSAQYNSLQVYILHCKIRIEYQIPISNVHFDYMQKKYCFISCYEQNCNSLRYGTDLIILFRHLFLMHTDIRPDICHDYCCSSDYYLKRYFNKSFNKF